MRSDTHDRQWRLFRRLEARRRGASAAELAEALGVSPRTVYRDLKALTGAGLPLVSEREGATTVWRLTTAPGSAAAPPLTLGEAAAVAAAASELGAASPFAEPLAAAMAKAQASVPGVDLEALVEALSAPGADGGPDRADHLVRLGEALEAGRSLEIRYVPLGRKRPMTHHVHPLSLRRHPHGLLLLAEDLDGAPRTLRVDRIHTLTLGDETRPAPVELELERGFREALGVFAGGSPMEVRIAVDAAAGKVLAAEPFHPTQRLERRADGTGVLELTITDTPELRGWIRAFGPAMTVLAPESLARDLAAEAAAVHRAYARRLDLPSKAPRPPRRPTRRPQGARASEPDPDA